ncbi:MAG: thymidylate synthase [bacterium]|nr:thymidylate synthase [bacterium]
MLHMTDLAVRAPAEVIAREQLYLPEKYQVHLGTGTVGFCTAWNEAKAAVTLAPSLLEKAAMIGTLYSITGVNIIVRNLALNPFIRKLYVWGHGQLSNTKFGIVARHALMQLWEHGANEDGTIPGTSARIEKEIDRKVLDAMRAQVELIDVSDKELPDAVRTIDAVAPVPYMEPVRFPEAVPETPDSFPSERVGWIVRGHGVIDTWLRVVERILRYGTVKGTQYGSQQKELLGVTWVIHEEDPSAPRLPTDWPLELRETVGATAEAIQQYHDVFLSPEKPQGVSYTYGNRLQRYPGPDGPIDQVADAIVRNLKASPDTRRAVATTLVPWIDAKSDEPPCITQVQGIQSHGDLHFLVTVRSHDIFKAAIPNAFGLRLLQQRVAMETGLNLGCLQITSQSAHFYEADWDNAKKLVACAFWEAPPKKLSGEDMDPRGVFLVRIQNGRIIVEFSSREGTPLFSVEGTSADHLVLQLTKYDLFSQTSHALDIGVQLARAETALRKGAEFTQDRPLTL